MNVIRNTSRVEIVLPNEYIVNELKNVMCYDIFSIVILLYAWYSCHENLNLARHSYHAETSPGRMYLARVSIK